MTQIKTQRLLLRQWIESDAEPFAAPNADPQVMQYFPSVRNRVQSDALLARCYRKIDQDGWGFWAVELNKTGEFIGFIGLNRLQSAYPFSPCVEIAWRLAQPYWHHGYASEGARQVLGFAFQELKLDDVVAMTARYNLPSKKVMQAIGMVDTKQNFLHPEIGKEHDLCEHILYKITNAEWLKKNNK